MHFELSGNVCTEQTSLMIGTKIVLNSPCVSVYALLFLILTLLKLVLKQRISLVMTNLIAAILLMQISLGFTAYKSANLYVSTTTKQNAIFTFCPLFGLTVQYILNLWISIVHKSILRHSGFQTSMCWYVISSLFTYHSLSQVKLTSHQNQNEEQ